MSDDHDAAAPEAEPIPAPPGAEDLRARLDHLDHKIDTVAGAMAAVAATQTELLEQGREVLHELGETAAAQRADLALALEALAGVTETLERTATRNEDRLASIRDAAAVPVADLQALLTARTERTDAQLQALIERVDATLPQPATAATGELEAFGSQVEELRDSVRSLSWQLPELAEELAALRTQVEGLDLSGPLQETADDLADDLRNHTDTALAATLRVLDERLHGLRTALVPAPTPPAGGMGFEAGAVMGAVQAAWNRLEQRLDKEFDDLGRQLHEMEARVQQALTTAEAAANRPVVTGEQIRKTASSMREALLTAREHRRQRREGPPSLGRGSG